MKPILLTELPEVNNPTDYKLHLGVRNGQHNPLDLFALDFNNWKAWNEWKGTKGLFGGVFEVKKR